MDSLLRWSIENSTPRNHNVSDDGTGGSTRPPQRLDPAIIDVILGKPDSELMKEDIAVAIDASKYEGERTAALDHLEMLIENIDNANDLQKLNLWKPLNSLLTSPNSTNDIRVQALWVVGTAVQNNPAAQDAYLTYDPLPTLFSFLAPSPSSTREARAKAIYAISGLVKHNAPAVEALSRIEVNGWVRLRDALQDPDIAVRRKTAFLLNTVILPTNPNSTPALRMAPQPAVRPPVTTNSRIAARNGSIAISSAPLTVRPNPRASAPRPGVAPVLHSASQPNTTTNTPIHAPIHANSHAAHLRDTTRSDTTEIALEAFVDHFIIEAVIDAVTNPLPYGEDGENDAPDLDFEEKAIHLLFTYAVACRRTFTAEQKTRMKGWIDKERREAGGNGNLIRRWAFAPAELSSLLQRLR